MSAIDSPLTPPQVVNLSDLHPPWNWVGHRFRASLPDWQHCTSARSNSPAGTRSARLRSLACAVGHVRRHQGASLLVAHGPRPTHLWCSLGRRLSPPTPVLAFSFNFTTLPTGRHQRFMARAFAHVERFVVASSVERSLYADHFDLDPQRIDVLLWGVQPPLAQMQCAPLKRGEYICALGSQGRDYATLLEAMRSLPHISLVVVATPDSLPDTALPQNVEVRTNIPRSEAMNLLAHSRLMVLPMRDSQVPCGHVTAVSAMHMGKAVVATDTVGLHDYLRHEHNALLAPPQDSVSLAACIDELMQSPLRASEMGAVSKALAQEHCTEDAVCAYLQRFVKERYGWGPSIHAAHS